MPPNPSQLVKWSNELAASLGKPEASKFVYDWVKASGGAIPSADEVARLSRAVEQGFNTVGYRYSSNPAKDEKHLQKMLLEPKRLADENRAFHVDITPGAPASNMRFTNVNHDAENEALRAKQIRPLALRLENLINGSDEQANSTRFLNDALSREATGVRYTPTEGELSGPAHDRSSSFFDLAERSNSAYQPSVAMVDPTAVRDLRSAKFTPRSKAALTAAVAAGTTPLLQAEERAPTANQVQMTHKPFNKAANPLSQLARGWAAGTLGLPGDLEGLARMAIKYGASPGSYVDRNMGETSALPTSDFYREWLPGKSEGIGGEEMENLGSLAGGAGSTLPAKYGIKAAKVAARNAMVPSTLSKQAGKFIDPVEVLRSKLLARESLSEADRVALAAAREAVPEQKMLQGFYRGYAGDLPQTMYHAGAAFKDTPRPGTFVSPDKEAVKQFGKATRAKQLHTFDAKPRRGGDESDVYDMAKRMGIYEEGVPAGQYLEQGENAIYPEAGQMVEELHNLGLDHLMLNDGMSKSPSMVILDPAMVSRNQGVFLSPQRSVAEYYAQKRAAQSGDRPHVEMILADPFAGRTYTHSTLGSKTKPPIETRARQIAPDQVVNRTPLYSRGGLAQLKECSCHKN